MRGPARSRNCSSGASSPVSTPLRGDDMTRAAFLVDGCRTPMGKVGGVLAHVRPDDLATLALRAILGRNPNIETSDVDDVYWGAANQAGEDNRNVARMAVLLAGLPATIPGATV